MEISKKRTIQLLVDSSIKNFAEGFYTIGREKIIDLKEIINFKKDNISIVKLEEKIHLYPDLARSFDGSFGKILENMGNSIAKVSYDVKGNIQSFILPSQTQHIADLMSHYDEHERPEIEHYTSFKPIIPRNIESFKRTHATDNYFYSPEKKEHYLVELKAGGDLDNKKSRAEKISLLDEYYLLENLLLSNPDTKNDKIFIYFATAYNKDGESNKWSQERVRQYFCEEELKIGKDYWNFVCDDEMGFEIVSDQLKKVVVQWSVF